jgi:hypothetical protein
MELDEENTDENSHVTNEKKSEENETFVNHGKLKVDASDQLTEKGTMLGCNYEVSGNQKRTHHLQRDPKNPSIQKPCTKNCLRLKKMAHYRSAFLFQS